MADEESWTQFLKISCQNPSDKGFIEDDGMHYCRVVLLLLAEDGDTLMLKSKGDKDAVLYYWKDNRKEQIKFTASRFITNNITREEVCGFWAMDYTESLVSIS